MSWADHTLTAHLDAARRSNQARARACRAAPTPGDRDPEDAATESGYRLGVKARAAHVFTTAGNAPISGFSKAKARFDQTIAKARDGDALAPWAIQICDAPSATEMSRLGVTQLRRRQGAEPRRPRSDRHLRTGMLIWPRSGMHSKSGRNTCLVSRARPAPMSWRCATRQRHE